MEFPLFPKAFPGCLCWQTSLLLPCLHLARAVGPSSRSLLLSWGLFFCVFPLFLSSPPSLARPRAEFARSGHLRLLQQCWKEPAGGLGDVRSPVPSSSSAAGTRRRCLFAAAPPYPLLPAAEPGEGLAAAPASSSPGAPPCRGTLHHAWQITAALWELEEDVV